MKRTGFLISLIFFTTILTAMDRSGESSFELTSGYFTRQGSRPHMEDVVTMLPQEEFGAFFGVYDGHGGKQTSDYAGKYLHQILNENLKSDPQTPIQEQFDKSFNRVDKKLEELNIRDDGSTALVGLVQKNQLHLAWAGDSRAMIMRDSKVLLTTTDHKPALEEERIIKAGGLVVIWGNSARIRPDGFALSRALGNLAYDAKKQKVMIVNPDVKTVFIKPGDTLLMATDGFWDDIPNDDVCEKVGSYLKKNAKELKELSANQIEFCDEIFSFGGDDRLRMIAQLLCNDAVKAYPCSDGIQNNSCDNISVLLVTFKDKIAAKAKSAAPESVL